LRLCATSHVANDGRTYVSNTSQRIAMARRWAFDAATGMLARTRVRLGVGDRERVRRLEVLAEVGQIVNSSLEMPSILAAVAGSLHRAVPFVRLNFSFYEPSTDTIAQHHVFANDRGTVRDPVVVPAGGTSARRAIEERRTILTPDVRLSPAPHPCRLAAEGVLSTVSVPIFREGRCLGVLNVGGARVDAFSPPRVRFLEALAAHLSVAIDNARLFAELRRELAERRRAEEALTESERGLRALVGSLDDTVYEFDAQGTYLNVWTGDERLLLRPKAELLGRCVVEVMGDEVGRAYIEDLRRVLRTGRSEAVEYALDLPAGTRWFLSSMNAVRGPDGGHRTVSILSRDITERKRAEEALARSEAQYRRIVETAQEGIWELDAKHRTTFANRKLAEMLGTTVDAMLGEPLSSFMDEAGRTGAAASLERQVRGGEERLECKFRRRDGGEVWAIVAANPIVDGAGFAAGALALVTDISERMEAEASLVRLAHYDQLTGLPNRALFLERLGQALARAEGLGRAVAVLFLDLDNFKVINDSLGHGAGDRLLAAVAARLRSSVRVGDTAARFGGDEFAVLLEDLGDDCDATETADRVVRSLHAPVVLDGHEVCPSFSVGVATSAPNGDTPERMLRHADLAMYRAKANGKAQYAVFDEAMATDAMDRLTLEAELRQALARDELRVDYQPIVDLGTGRIAELEALVRWQHPRYGLVPPARFIPIAEETGLIVPIGHWVLDQACRQAQDWRDALPDARDLAMSVNLSARQFRHPGLVADVVGVLRATGLAPGALKLEITESVLMQHMEGAIATMHELKALGVRLAIDDFGTGYSSLAYLKHFPVDTLKIDRSFVRGIGRDHGDVAIVRSVIALADSLHLAVTAEGIETAEQLEELQALGCDRGQGFFLARPASDDAVRLLLAAESSLLEHPICPTTVTAAECSLEAVATIEPGGSRRRAFAPSPAGGRGAPSEGAPR
jgi:diguanylate cyclase (GGDEF)-like protein/PAS domain S-box-containing protein